MVSQLTLKDHHTIRLKEGKKAMGRLRRLTGQMGLSPTNCKKAMTACIQSVAMFESELWWKGDHVRGTIGQAAELQLLVNQEARLTTGCFRTTNLEVLSVREGLRPAAAQLENWQRRFGLRLLSLPQGDQAREVGGAPTAIGRRLTNALAYARRVESTVLLEEPETLDAELLQEEEAEAKAEAEKERLGLVMFTDGSRLYNGATGYAVVWKNGQTWKGIKTHMGCDEAGIPGLQSGRQNLRSLHRSNTVYSIPPPSHSPLHLAVSSGDSHPWKNQALTHQDITAGRHRD